MSAHPANQLETLHSDHPDIIDAFERAYTSELVSATKPEIAHTLPYCDPVSFEAGNNLCDMGYDVYFVSRALRDGLAHNYLITGEESGGLILDGTWQQFIPTSKRIRNSLHRKAEPLPKVMVGTPQMVVSAIAQSGVRKNWLGLWAPPSDDLIADNLFGISNDRLYSLRF